MTFWQTVKFWMIGELVRAGMGIAFVLIIGVIALLAYVFLDVGRRG